MKLFWRVTLIVFVVVASAALIWYFFVRTIDHSTTTTLAIGQTNLKTQVVIDEAERTRGLSGSQPLGDDQAMLFVFPAEDTWGIWMKEMNYPIDIVWLDKDKTVQHIVENAQPSSYPSIFRPAQPMRYVLEMKAGTVKHKSITIGARAEFTLP